MNLSSCRQSQNRRTGARNQPEIGLKLVLRRLFSRRARCRKFITRSRFEQEPFAAALAAGRTLTVDQALDEALAEAPHSEPLTAREGDLAARREQFGTTHPG